MEPVLGRIHEAVMHGVPVDVAHQRFQIPRVADRLALHAGEEQPAAPAIALVEGLRICVEPVAQLLADLVAEVFKGWRFWLRGLAPFGKKLLKIFPRPHADEEVKVVGHQAEGERVGHRRRVGGVDFQEIPIVGGFSKEVVIADRVVV